MPFYIRKSVKAGPFRFNFSNSGVGVSVGIRGLRIGTGPRGHYIHAGAGGLYYRASLGRAGERRDAGRTTLQPSEPVQQGRPNRIALTEIESGDVLAMQDEAFGDLLREINQKSAQTRMAVVIAAIFGVLAVLAMFAVGPGGIAVVFLALPGWLLGAWFDSYRRTTVLFYNLEQGAESAYKELLAAFDGLATCHGKWHIEAGGRVDGLTEWKRNAGASRLVQRKSTELAYKIPVVVRSNVTPPVLRVGRQFIYFLPDVALIEDGARFGAVGYGDLQLQWQDSRFIEEGRVPHDTQVVTHTWQHPNKSGGPDRRFASNRQIPVCLYSSLAITSASGLNELVEFSKPGAAQPFVAAAAAMVAHTRKVAPGAVPTPALPRPNSDEDLTPTAPESTPKKRKLVWIAAFAGIAALVIVGFGARTPTTPAPERANAAPAATIASSPTAVTPPTAPAVKPPPVNQANAVAVVTERPASPTVVDDRPLTVDDLREIQSRLKKLGFDAGDVDGIVGPQTGAAIGRYEMAKGLARTGVPTRPLLERLRAETTAPAPSSR